MLIPVTIGILLITFAIVRLIPGDPCVVMLGERATQAKCDEFKARYGLDQPIPIQFGRYVANLSRGDFGASIRTGQNVTDVIAQRLPMTIELAFFAMIFSSVVGILLGVISAVRRNSAVDLGTMVIANVGVSMPVFWLGMLLIIALALNLRWLPTFGRGPSVLAAIGAMFHGDTEAIVDTLRHILMPAATLGLTAAALIMRMVRSTMLEVLRQDYIRTARAKGLAEKTVVYKHALRNALLPVITIVGLQFGALLGGAVVTESIFAWPGVGQLAVQAIAQRDFPVIQGTVLTLALTFSVVNLLVDISYAWINPKIRYE